MNNNYKIKIVIYYAWIVVVGLTALSVYSFIKINVINYNVIPIVMSVFIIISIKHKEILAFQMTGIISFFAGLLTLSSFIPFEGKEIPAGFNMFLLLIVAIILIAMSGLCLDVSKNTKNMNMNTQI